MTNSILLTDWLWVSKVSDGIFFPVVLGDASKPVWDLELQSMMLKVNKMHYVYIYY